MVSKSSYHDGEIAVQQRAGRSFPGRIRNVIPPVAAEFLTQHDVCTIAGLGQDGRMWTTMLCGPVGFMNADDEQTMHVRAAPLPSDPLHRVLAAGGDVGTIVLDGHRRMRVNGVLEPADEGFVIHTEQVFSNCGRYISERQGTPVAQTPGPVTRGNTLTSAQAALIRSASTFLIGTRHPDGSADASHRGGDPGFVRVDDEGTLQWPDYDGNNMYMTLGNLAVDPRVGLLFLDWAEGTLLQVSGRATVDWTPEAAAELPGALRVVRMNIDAVQQTVHGVPMHWSAATLSRFNPAQHSPVPV